MNKTLFNKISIIESLKDSDLHTGKKLKEDLDLFCNIFNNELYTEYFEVSNAIEFRELLQELTIESEQKGSFPILHVEVHGSDKQDGLILESGEFLSWNELRPLFSKLNQATKFNLLLVLSMCSGGHFIKELGPNDRAPCWGMVGPTDTIAGRMLLTDFSSFYQEFFKTLSGDSAIKKLNSEKRDSDTDYLFTTAIAFFKTVYADYLKKYCTHNLYRERAQALRKKLKKQKKSNLPNIGRIIRDYKSQEKYMFEKYKTKYFMIDLFPENENRFEITYSDVKML